MAVPSSVLAALLLLTPKKALPLVPGVMCDEGSGVDLQGGVEGGWFIAGLMVLLLPAEGELAR